MFKSLNDTIIFNIFYWHVYSCITDCSMHSFDSALFFLCALNLTICSSSCRGSFVLPPPYFFETKNALFL